MRDVPKKEVVRLLRQGNTLAEIAQVLGVSRQTLARRCDEWGIDYGKKEYIRGKWNIETPLDYEISDEGVKNLACAIIWRACDDYVKLSQRGRDVLFLERFFCSEWFATLSAAFEEGYDGEWVLKQTKKRINNETNIGGR